MSKLETDSQNTQQTDINVRNKDSSCIQKSTDGVDNKKDHFLSSLTPTATKSTKEEDKNTSNVPRSNSFSDPSAIASILSKLQFPTPFLHTNNRPRPRHTLSLISLPSTTRGHEDPDNDAVTVTPVSTNSKSNTSTKLFGRGSTGNELLWDKKFQRQETHSCNLEGAKSGNIESSPVAKTDGGLSTERDVYRNKGSFNKVPKASQNARKLAKPYSINVPSTALGASYLYKGSPLLNEGGRPYSSSVLKPYENLFPFLRREGNSPSATSSSNNINNKMVNKPKRYKTARAETRLQKGLNTSTSSYAPFSACRPATMANKKKDTGTKTTKSELPYFSTTTKDVVNMNCGAPEDEKRNGKGESKTQREKEFGQQASFFGRTETGFTHTTAESGIDQSNWKMLSGSVNMTSSSILSLSTKLTDRVQVVRSAEEKESSPESIRMNGMGLKAFPCIGGGEGPNLKILSLQRNFINRLENAPSHLSHLVVLDLYDNRIERITGLQGFPSLRVLLLGKNRIRRIEGLDGVKRLEILDLHGNQLRYVDRLGALSSLRVLNIAGNLLRSIRNLGGNQGLTALTELNLKRNRIRNLEGLTKAPHLKKLLLANNEIQSFTALLPLRKLLSMEELLLEPNPLCSAQDSRHQVLTMLPWLITLDRVEISDTMRLEAKQWHRRKLAEEEERKKAEDRLRTASPTAGPPNSREQAIYQARRRWESVKNFVKNSNSKSTNPSSPSLAATASTFSNENGTLLHKGEIGLPIGPVMSEIDDDLNSHFRSKSRSETLFHNSSKEQKSKEVVVLPECPVGRDVKLNLALLDMDLDQNRHPQAEGIQTLVNSEGGLKPPLPLPESQCSCPPSMINDLSPPRNPMDYVNGNPNCLASTKQEGEADGRKVGLHIPQDSNSHAKDHTITGLTRQNEDLFLSSTQHQSSGLQKIDPLVTLMPPVQTLTKENTQSIPNCSRATSPQRSTFLSVGGVDNSNPVNPDRTVVDEEVEVGLDPMTTLGKTKEPTPKDTNYSRDKRMIAETMKQIAVVRPLKRDQNCDNQSTTVAGEDTDLILDSVRFTRLPPFTGYIIRGSKSECDITKCGIDDVNDSLLPIDNQIFPWGNVRHPFGNSDNQVSQNIQTHSNFRLSSDCYNSNSNDFMNADLQNNRLVPSDFNCDKMKESNKSEIITFSSGILTEGNPVFVTTTDAGEGESSTMGYVRNGYSSPSDTTERTREDDKSVCPTFTHFETLNQQSINTKEEETRIINNNPTSGITTRSGGGEVTSLASAETSAASTFSSSFPHTDHLTLDNNAAHISQETSNVGGMAGPGNPTVTSKPNLRKLRSASFDGRLLSSCGGTFDSEDDLEDDETSSVTTATGSNTTIATISDTNSPRNRLGFSKKQLLQRTKSRGKVKDHYSVRVQSSYGNLGRVKSGTVSNLSFANQGGSAANLHAGHNRANNKQLRRCDSAISLGVTGAHPLENNGGNYLPPLKRHGTDYLVEIDGKVLSIYGQGALKHTMTAFPSNVACTVTTAKFHYISFDSVIPFFGKLRQIYPSLEHFQFRANNIVNLSQLNALSDLQGLTSLHIAKEGNHLVSHDGSWVHYASYRLAHWGLQNVNGKEVTSDYRVGPTGSSKSFESLGFLALSCLPQTALMPLAKRLHMLHCFCCCSPSSSSEESAVGKGKHGKYGNERRTGSPLPSAEQQHHSSSSGNICTSWDDDPVLLDVIGKEALVYIPRNSHNSRSLSPPLANTEQGTITTTSDNDYNNTSMERRKATDILHAIVDDGVEAIAKLQRLEKTWDTLMAELVQDILMDYSCMESYMKKEFKKCTDAATLALSQNNNASANKK